MKKTLFGTLVFSLILSSLVYAEADADKMRERREQREKEQQQGIIENSNSVESSNGNVVGTTTTNLSPEEEKEARRLAAVKAAQANQIDAADFAGLLEEAPQI